MWKKQNSKAKGFSSLTRIRVGRKELARGENKVKSLIEKLHLTASDTYILCVILGV